MLQSRNVFNKIEIYMEKVDVKFSHSTFLSASLSKNNETFNKIEGELLQ